MENTIHQYVKKTSNGKTRTVGVLVGGMGEDKIIRFGWSKAALTKGDRFFKGRGLELANIRLEASMERTNILYSVPRSMIEDAQKFQARCKRYFKDSVAMCPLFPKPQKKKELENS